MQQYVHAPFWSAVVAESTVMYQQRQIKLFNHQAAKSVLQTVPVGFLCLSVLSSLLSFFFPKFAWSIVWQKTESLATLYTRARIFNPFKETRNWFPDWRAGKTTLFDVPARPD